MRGSIRKRLTKSGAVRYDVIYRARGRQVWKSFRTRREADAHLAGAVTDVAAGTYRRVQPKNLGDIFRAWLVAVEADIPLGRMKRSTFRSYTSVVARHLIPAFGHLRSDGLDTKELTAWKVAQSAKVAGNMSAKTHNNIVGVLKCAVDWAVTQQYLGANPMPTKRLRATVRRDERAIVQAAEIGRLWNAAEGQDRVIVALALFAGLRRGEVFGLQWADIQWPKGRIKAALRVRGAWVQGQLVTPKSKAGARLVQLPVRLVDLLRSHAQTRPEVVDGDGRSFVVRQADGSPMEPDNWAKRDWPRIRAAAKLPAALTLHGLRHTFGSLLLADGAPVKHVSEQMGHASPLITMQVYQHVLRATSATATRQLDKHIPATVKKPLRLVKSA
jgi:integrase